MIRTVSVEKILELLENREIDFRFEGNNEIEIEGVSPLDEYKKNTLTWIKNKNVYQEKKQIVKQKDIMLIVLDYNTQEMAKFENAIICNNPKHVFSIILEAFFEEKLLQNQRGGNLIIGENVQISESIFIGNNCVIGNNVKIGRGPRISHNVVINDNVEIGEGCYIHSGVIVGDEGAGYSLVDGKYLHVPQVGGVKIGNHVDIYANTCIDRGTLGDTKIGDGCVICSLCHIGHNAEIGNNVMILNGTIICGSAKIRNNVYLAPGSIIRNQVTVGEDCVTGMGAVITKNAKEATIYAGYAARPIEKKISQICRK